MIAATNNHRILDRVLLRSGRFDLKIKIDFPTVDDKILQLGKLLNLADHSIDNETLQRVASEANFSCADIACIVNELKYLSNKIFIILFFLFYDLIIE